MDQVGQSAETLTYVPSEPTIKLDITFMSDSTTLTRPSTPASVISSSLPAGGSQSPSVSSTTYPLDDGISGIASSPDDVINADTSLKKFKKPNKEMKRFQCQFCDKAFSSRGNKTVHERVHNGEKPYCCDICSRSFSQLENLKTHKNKMHSTEKLQENESIGMKAEQNQRSRSQSFNKCDVCGKVFARKNHLLSHLMIHSGEKPFKCQQCDKSFRTQSSLARHNRTHTGEKPYSCQFCDKKFIHPYQLRNHGKIHPSSGDNHGSRGNRVEKNSKDLKIRSPRHEMQEKTEKDWMKEFGVRECYVALHNFVHYLPGIEFL